MATAGSIIVVCVGSVFGSVTGTSGTIEQQLYISGTFVDGLTNFGSVLLGTHAFIGQKNLSAGNHIVKLEVLNGSGFTNPRTQAKMVLLRSYR